VFLNSDCRLGAVATGRNPNDGKKIPFDQGKTAPIA